VTPVLFGECHRDAFRGTWVVDTKTARDRRRAREPNAAAIDPPHVQRLRHRGRAGGRHIIEGEKLDRRAAPHVGEIGQHAGNIRGHRRRRRPINYARAGAAAPLRSAALAPARERAAHRDPRYAVIFSQLVLGGQLGAEAKGAAEDAVAYNRDKPASAFASPSQSRKPLSPAEMAAGRPLYLVFFSVQY